MFKEVASLEAENVVALGKVDKKTGKKYPKSAEGYYLGSRTVENKRGESKLHFLQTAEGNLGLWGTTDLNRKLGQVTPGEMIRVTSTGTKPTPNGEMYTYKVERDTENTIDVSGLVNESSSEQEDSDDSDDTYNTGFQGVDAEDEEETDYSAVAAAAAERKARVEALLGKNKTKTAKN